MKLYIDYMNFIIEYIDDNMATDYWNKHHVLIDVNNLEDTHEQYLQLVRTYLPNYSDKLTTFEQFKNRLLEFYARKESCKRYFLDITNKDSKLSTKDKLQKLNISQHKAKPKNTGTQLNLNFFD